MDDDEIVEPFADPTPEQVAKWKAAEVARLETALRREALSQAITVNPQTHEASIILKDAQSFFEWLSGK